MGRAVHERVLAGGFLYSAMDIKHRIICSASLIAGTYLVRLQVIHVYAVVVGAHDDLAGITAPGDGPYAKVTRTADRTVRQVRQAAERC